MNVLVCLAKAMGPTESLNEDEDELAQLLLAAENDIQADEADRTTAPSLTDSASFVRDLATGTTETSTDENPSNGFSTALNRSLHASDKDESNTNRYGSFYHMTTTTLYSFTTIPIRIIATTADALDSSDDEDVSNFLNRKYNEYGRDIQNQIKRRNEEKHEQRIARDVDNSIRSPVPKKPRGIQPIPHEFPTYQPTPPALRQSAAAGAAPAVPKSPPSNIGIYTDPVFGLRIVHPLISSTVLQERMLNRSAVSLTALPSHIVHGDKERDWAVAGVIVSKSAVMTSKKGSQYIIWKLSDLRPPDLKQVSVFLFKNAYKDLWKTAQGMAVAILNPGVMDNDKQSGETTLSLDTTQKCMILGQSKDMGTCKSRKKNGDQCTALVNKHACEYCVFHVKQEYAKMSTRVELQSATSGRGLEALRNKVLGKSEVFYGGQSFMATSHAVPAKKNARLAAKDQKLLMTLSASHQAANAGASASNAATVTRSPATNAAALRSQPTSHIAGSIEASGRQRQRDLERLQQLEAENERFKSQTVPAASSVAPKVGTLD